MQGTIHVDDDSPTSNAHGHLQPDVMSSAASVHAQPAINALAMLRRETVAEGSWPMSSSRRSSSWTLRPIPARRSKEPAVDPMTRSDGEWCSGVASWSQEEVETEQGEGEHAPSAPIAPNLRVRLDQATKWGRCPVHTCQHSLRPHVFQSGQRAGSLTLMCCRWFNKTASSNGRECWGQKPFPMDCFHDLSAFHQRQYRALPSVMSRNARSA